MFFNPPCPVQNIRHPRGSYITIHLKYGKFHVTKESTSKGYGVVYFGEGNISNIFSFSNIRENYLVHYDTVGGYFSIMKPDKVVFFRHSP